MDVSENLGICCSWVVKIGGNHMQTQGLTPRHCHFRHSMPPVDVGELTMPGIIIFEVGMKIKHFKETTKQIWFGQRKTHPQLWLVEPHRFVLKHSMDWFEIETTPNPCFPKPQPWFPVNPPSDQGFLPRYGSSTPKLDGSSLMVHF